MCDVLRYVFSHCGSICCFQTVSVPFSEKAKDNQIFIEYHEEDVQDSVIQAVLRQSYRMFTVS